MATVDELRIVMDAETARLMTRLAEADRRMARFETDTAARLKRIDGHFRGMLGGAVALGGGLGTGQIVEYASAWARVDRALRASEDIFGIKLHSAEEMVRFANDARIDVEAYAKTYTRTAAAIRDYGFSSDVAAKFATSLSMALKLGSATGSEQASVLLQVSQALQKGKLDGDEFRSVMENAGVVQELLADRLKVSKGEIVSMAKEGRLKVQDLVGAMTDGADKIERLFRAAPQTVDDAIGVLKNSMIQYVGQLDRATGGSEKLIRALNGTAANMQTVGDGAIVVGAGLLAAFGPRALASIARFGGGALAAAGPMGLLAAILGSSAAALDLFGGKVAVSADGIVTVKDTAQALVNVIGGKLTPLMDQAAAAWAVAVAKIQDAMSGVPVSFEDVASAARAAVNITIGVFMYAARTIKAAFTTLPPAIGEMFVAMANNVVATVEAMVARVVETMNIIPGISITPTIDLGRIANPLAGAGAKAREEFAAAGDELGRDFVGEASRAIKAGASEIETEARRIAMARRWMEGTRTERTIEPKRGKPPFDEGLYAKQLAAYEQMQEVYKKALDATEHYRSAVTAEYEKDLAKFQELLRKKIISQEEFNKVRSNLQIVAAKEMLDAAEKEFRKLREVSDVVAGSMQSAFDRFAETGKFSFSEMTRSMIADLAKLAFKMMVLQPLFGSSGQGFGLIGSLVGLPMGNSASSGFGGWSTSVKLPGFADGGRPPTGMPSIVGERGPELFIPDVAGRVVPNDRIGRVGVGGEIVVTVVASPELHASIRSTAEGVVARQAPAIVSRAVSVTNQALPGMIKSADRRGQL